VDEMSLKDLNSVLLFVLQQNCYDKVKIPHPIFFLCHVPFVTLGMFNCIQELWNYNCHFYKN